MGSEAMDYELPESFVGKVMHCRTNRSGAVLVNWHFESIGGKLFAVGMTPEAGWPGYESKPTAIAWDKVETIYLFDSVDEWQASNRKWGAARRKMKTKSWFSWG